jgi:hypothetical protein
MNTLIAGLPADFFMRLLTGIAVDLEIAGFALVLGLLVGVPLAMLLALGGPTRLLAAITVQLLRAAPTFVVMFILLGVMPHVIDVAGWHIPISGETTVALSLLPYSASTIAASVDDARRLWRGGSALAALLLLPNIARAYFVLVMSSGAAAAIGVTEGIAVILRQANNTQALSDRLLLFALGILVFGTILQTSFFLINRLRVILARHVIHRASLAQL